MTNHPNRGRNRPDANPAPDAITAAREAAGLSQTAAGALVHVACRTWQQWEAGDRRMHPGLWELFRAKTASLPETAGEEYRPIMGHHNGKGD